MKKKIMIRSKNIRDCFFVTLALKEQKKEIRLIVSLHLSVRKYVFKM